MYGKLFLGKIRNRRTKEEKEETTNNAVRAAAKERIHNQKNSSSIVPRIKEKKSFTQKEWSKYGDAQKDILSNRYDVTLSDHETRKEKWTRRGKAVNFKNFDKVMNKFDEGSKTFFKEFDKGFSEAGMKSKGTVYSKSKGGSNSNKIFGSGSKSKIKF